MRKSFKHISKRLGAAVLSATVITSSVATGAALTASAADSNEGVIPSKLYGVSIVDTDDYITAVRHTIKSTAAIRSAEEAVKRTDSQVDLSKSPYFPKIGNQSSINSCTGWANVYYQFTYEMNKSLGRNTTPENSFQPMFIYNLIVGGKNEGTSAVTMYELLSSNGCVTFSSVSDTMNFSTWNPDYTTWREANNYRISNYMYYEGVGDINSRITSPDDPDIAAIKATLRDGHLISFSGYITSYQTMSLKASPDSRYNQGIAGEQVIYKQVGMNGSHAMTIVGYNDNVWTDINKNNKIDSGELGAFKMVNSYGETYGNKGFNWIAYDAINYQSVVEGVGYENYRSAAMRNFVKLNVAKDFKSSNIYRKYTLNTDNRGDSYLSITATRKKDGVKYTRTTTPYLQALQTGSKALSYDGTAGFKDGTMIVDLDNLVPDLNSNNFNDYNWSVDFVDLGKDSSALTVKDAIIVDENSNRTYPMNVSFPFSVNNSTRTVSLKSYYQFSKLNLTAPDNAYVGSEVKFVAKAENESRGSNPIKYYLTISRDGKVVANKVTKVSTVDSANKTSTVKIKWTPTKAGNYSAVLTATDSTGILISRSMTFKVYNKKLAVRSIDTNTDRNVPRYEKVVITPHVTGGTGNYTYSYYYQKGSKTYTILKDTKKTSVAKRFGNTGPYKLIVKVKDSAGTTAQYSRYIVVQPTTVIRIHNSYDYAQVGDSVQFTPILKNAYSELTKRDYSFSVTKKGGATQQVVPDRFGYHVWKVTEAGDYTVHIVVRYKDKVIAEKDFDYSVKNNKKTIKVNVISYVVNEKSKAAFQIHYWGGASGIGDVACTPLSTTVVKNVGFWGSAQTFYQYVANIPLDATGYKFHIGDRWFPATGGDGNTATSNTVYVFNFDYDRCIYSME